MKTRPPIGHLFRFSDNFDDIIDQDNLIQHSTSTVELIKTNQNTSLEADKEWLLKSIYLKNCCVFSMK